MAEPLFIVADIHISAPALRRWLKSAPLSAAAFDDWPASASLGASGITELAAPEKPSVADALVSYCADGFGRGGHLHCQHDEQAHALDSRRASSMATRPAPWRPRFSLRFAARIGGRLHGKAALARPPVRRRRRSDPYRDRQAVLACPACSGACASRAPWFDDWISQDNLGDRQAHGRAVPSPGPRPEEAAGAGRAASQPGCAPPLRQPLLDRRRACVSMARRPAGASAATGLSGGSRPPTPWTRRSTRMDDRSGTTAPWWGRARTGA